MQTRRIHSLGLLLFTCDLFAIAGAYYSTLLARFNNDWGDRIFTWLNRTLGVRESGDVGEAFHTFYIVSGPRIIFLLAVVLATLYALWDLYADRRFLRRRPVLWRIIVCNVMALVIFYAYFYLSRNVFHPRSMFATMLFLNAIYATLLRTLLERVLHRLRLRHGIDSWPVILVGRNRDADRILEIIAESPSRSLFLAEHLEAAPAAEFEAMLARLREAVARQRAELVILADSRCSIDQIMRFLEVTDDLGVDVKILSRELDVLLTRARIESDLINGIPLVHFAAPTAARRFERAKRAGSSLVAAAAVLVSAPLLALIALLVRVTSKGPVFFVQDRIGVDRKPFRMLKFRTMVLDADAKLAQMEKDNQSGTGLFKIRKDPRITWIGGFLRRYSLDELPQLLNVVRGDMTLVGPRPLPRRDFANYYAQWHYGRHAGLPGLTCLWQVSGRSDLDFHSMCILDVYYLRNQNFVLDLKVIWRTVWVVVFARGAY